MAKADVSFVRNISSDAEWETQVARNRKPELLVIDVHSKCWGPTEMLNGHLSRWFYESEDSDAVGVIFMRACADNIGALRQFRGDPQSSFMLYLQGQRCGVIKGPSLLGQHDWHAVANRIGKAGSATDKFLPLGVILQRRLSGWTDQNFQ